MESMKLKWKQGFDQDKNKKATVQAVWIYTEATHFLEIVVYMFISGELSWKLCASNRIKNTLCHHYTII